MHAADASPCVCVAQSLPEPIQLRHRILPGLSPALISELPLVTAGGGHKPKEEDQDGPETEDT